jgi:ferredoxin-NADP reductase
MFVASPTRITDVTRYFGQHARTLLSFGRRWAVPAIDRASARVQLDAPLLEALLTKIEPTLSLRLVRAEVVSVVDETADTKSYWLRPNARFGTHRAGAYVTLHLRIAGQSIRRSYSVSSAPRADGLICITVKRVPGGLVSNWLADHLRPGTLLELSAPDGQFVLPTRPSDKLLMLSAGSGITPVMSMLRQLLAAGSDCQITFLHFARSPRDIIFHEELTRIAQTHPNVRIALCVESAEGHVGSWTGGIGRFNEAFLAEHAPEFRELDTYMCGPAGFMQAVMTYYEQADADLSKLRYERFDVALDLSKFLNHAQVIRFVRSGAESMSNRPRTILEEAERAGLSVESGCRAGNCGACRCMKRSGVVVDVLTGAESGPNEEFIYPCISVARGTVEVEL